MQEREVSGKEGAERLCASILMFGCAFQMYYYTAQRQMGSSMSSSVRTQLATVHPMESVKVDGYDSKRCSYPANWNICVPDAVAERGFFHSALSCLVGLRT